MFNKARFRFCQSILIYNSCIWPNYQMPPHRAGHWEQMSHGGVMDERAWKPVSYMPGKECDTNITKSKLSNKSTNNKLCDLRTCYKTNASC